MVTDDKKETKKKIAELQAIYAEFVKKLNELKTKRNKIINNITKRIEKKNIKEALDKLKKIGE